MRRPQELLGRAAVRIVEDDPAGIPALSLEPSASRQGGAATTPLYRRGQQCAAPRARGPTPILATCPEPHLGTSPHPGAWARSLTLGLSPTPTRPEPHPTRCGHCTVVLQGRLHIFCGEEGFESDRGPWTVLGAQSLQDEHYVADFSATPMERSRVLQISYADYQVDAPTSLPHPLACHTH